MTKVFRRASRCSGYGFLYNSILILALGLLSHSTSPGNKPSPSGGVWSEAQTVKNLPAMQETQVRSLGREDPLEEGMATHSSILAWRIPWTEEPGEPQSVGSHRVRQAETDRHTHIQHRLGVTGLQGGALEPGSASKKRPHQPRMQSRSHSEKARV